MCIRDSVTTDRTQSTSPEEWERFIFYRGLGEAPLPVQMRFSDGRITASTTERDGLHHLFVLRVENGRGAYTYTTALKPDSGFDQAVPAMDHALPLDQFVEQVSADVASRLVASGLYKKEALAMVNTWKSSYFKTDGVRVLFVMPQSWTDRFIPMRITPAPEQLVRVMVGRVELLDRDRESRAEKAIGALASSNPQVREQAFDLLRSEGRYVEPIVRRTLQASTDEQVRTLARRLLLTDFVTELRLDVDRLRGHALARGCIGKRGPQLGHEIGQQQATGKRSDLFVGTGLQRAADDRFHIAPFAAQEIEGLLTDLGVRRGQRPDRLLRPRLSITVEQLDAPDHDTYELLRRRSNAHRDEAVGP